MKPSAPKAHDGKNVQETPTLESKSDRKTRNQKLSSLGLWFLLLIGLIWVGFMIGKGGLSLGPKPSRRDLKLKEQVDSFGKNRSLEVSSRDELKKDISLLKDQMATVREMLNLSSLASAPPTLQLSTPRFYYWNEFKGLSFEPESGWENGCVNLPKIMDERSESVDLGGHCLFLCLGRDCSRMNSLLFGHFGKECIELRPNSPGVNHLEQIGYDNQISSFRLCQEN